MSSCASIFLVGPKKSPVAVRLATEAVDEAFEAPLAVGVEFERRAFYLALEKPFSF